MHLECLCKITTLEKRDNRSPHSYTPLPAGLEPRQKIKMISNSVKGKSNSLLKKGFSVLNLKTYQARCEGFKLEKSVNNI